MDDHLAHRGNLHGGTALVLPWARLVGVKAKTCDIPDDDGVLCDRPLHQKRNAIWPFCFEHGDVWRDYSTRSEKMFHKPLGPVEWAEWKKTGKVAI